MQRLPHSVIMVMVTGVDHAALPDGTPNVIAGLVDAALTGEENVTTKKLVIRMTLRLRLAKVGVTKTADQMPERKHHHLEIII